MKRIIITTLILLLAVCIFISPSKALADDLDPGIMFDPSLAGDIIYSARYGWGGGSGLNLATFKGDIVNLRGEWIIFDESANNEVGLGLSIDIVKGLKALGITWLPEALNPQVGILGTIDLKSRPQGDLCGFLSVINIPLK